jgi:hypothetical protein
MFQQVRRKPSPALVVAVLALCVAVAGTAVADPLGLSDDQITKIKQIAKRLADKRIKKKAPNLTVDDSAHLGAFGPNYYTTQSQHIGVEGPITLTDTDQTVAQVTVPTPSQRSINAIASMEIDGAGQLSCNLEVNDTEGPRLTQEVPATSGAMALNQTENFYGGGDQIVRLRCAEEALSDVTVRDIELSVIAVSTGPQF